MSFGNKFYFIFFIYVFIFQNKISAYTTRDVCKWGPTKQKIINSDCVKRLSMSCLDPPKQRPINGSQFPSGKRLGGHDDTRRNTSLEKCITVLRQTFSQVLSLLQLTFFLMADNFPVANTSTDFFYCRIPSCFIVTATEKSSAIVITTT